jgi:hypothetical protein
MCFHEADEPVIVQAVVPEAIVKAFNEGILRWLARLNQFELNTI